MSTDQQNRFKKLLGLIESCVTTGASWSWENFLKQPGAGRWQSFVFYSLSTAERAIPGRFDVIFCWLCSVCAWISNNVLLRSRLSQANKSPCSWWDTQTAAQRLFPPLPVLSSHHPKLAVIISCHTNKTIYVVSCTKWHCSASEGAKKTSLLFSASRPYETNMEWETALGMGSAKEESHSTPFKTSGLTSTNALLTFKLK